MIHTNINNRLSNVTVIQEYFFLFLFPLFYEGTHVIKNYLNSDNPPKKNHPSCLTTK